MMSNEAPKRIIGIGELTETDPEFKMMIDLVNNRIPGHRFTPTELDSFEDCIVYFYLGMVNNRYPNASGYPEGWYATHTRAARDVLVERGLISKEVGDKIERSLQNWEAGRKINE